MTTLPPGADVAVGRASRRWLLVNRTMSRNFEYIDDDGSGSHDKPASFVVDLSSFSPGKPDMILIAGPDVKSSPAVACANRPGLSKTFRVGLGDVIHAKRNVRWEDMKNESFFNKNWIWGFDLPNGRRVQLRWAPTSHHAVDGKSPSRFGTTNWKLVEADGPGDHIVGVFTGQGGVTRVCGTLQINVDWGKEFEYMVLMTTVAMFDKVKRARKAAISAST